MTDKRTPRAHLNTTPIEEKEEDRFPVSPLLVEHLERQFPVTLSPKEHPNNILANQAEQRGQQQVIDYLRNLSNQ